MNMAMTRIDPTASKAATAATATSAIRAMLTALAGMPRLVARSGSKVTISSSLKNSTMASDDSPR